MPHPSDFDNHLSAVTDSERKRFWASVPAETLTSVVRARAGDLGAEPWLRSLMDMGGLCFPRTLDGFRLTQSSTDHPLDAPFVEKNFLRIDAVARMMNMSRCDEVFANGVDGTTVNVISTSNIGEEWLAFHADFCKMLVTDDLAWRQEALAQGFDQDKIEASDHAKAVRNTLAVALATACMLDNPESVKLIAKHDAETMNVMMSLKVAGPWARMGLGSEAEPPTVTPYFCAMQFSATKAMDALVESGLDTTFAMGMDPRKHGLYKSKKPFDVLSLGKVFSPACLPEVYEKALRDRMATADNNAMQKFTSDVNDVLSSPESEDRTIFKYIPSLIKVGAFNLDPDRAASEACIYGVPTVLQHVAPDVEWRTHVLDLKGKDSPLYKGSQNAMTSDRRDEYDAAFESYFRGAAGAGYTEAAYAQTVQFFHSDEGRNQTPQPIHNLVMLNARGTVNAMLQAGLNPNLKMGEGVETPMDIAIRSNTGMDGLMRTALARNVANAVLAEMDADVAQVPKSKRVAP